MWNKKLLRTTQLILVILVGVLLGGGGGGGVEARYYSGGDNNVPAKDGDRDYATAMVRFRSALKRIVYAPLLEDSSLTLVLGVADGGAKVDTVLHRVPGLRFYVVENPLLCDDVNSVVLRDVRVNIVSEAKAAAAGTLPSREFKTDDPVQYLCAIWPVIRPATNDEQLLEWLWVNGIERRSTEWKTSDGGEGVEQLLVMHLGEIVTER